MTCGSRFVLTFWPQWGLFSGGFATFWKGGGTRFCKYFMGRKPLDDKIHGKNCNECGGGGGEGRGWGIFNSGDFFESRVSRRDVWKIWPFLSTFDHFRCDPTSKINSPLSFPLIADVVWISELSSITAPPMLTARFFLFLSVTDLGLINSSITLTLQVNPYPGTALNSAHWPKTSVWSSC